MAETWVIIVTVFLALQLAASTFTIDYFLRNGFHHNAAPYMYLSAISVGGMAISLLTFIGAKEPRRIKFTTQFLLDVGALTLFIGGIFAVMALSYGIYKILGDLQLGVITFSIYVAIGLFFYPFGYYKFLKRN